LAAGLLAAVVGCSREKSEEPQRRPFEGVSLRVVVPRGLDLATRWQLLLDEWCEWTGAEVAVTELPMQLGQIPNSPEAKQALSEANLVVFPLPDFSDYVEAGLVAPFPESQLSSNVLDWNDLLRGVRLAAGSVEQQAAALPISCPTLIGYYRADLLRKAGGHPPSTWDDYHRLVKDLDDWAPGHVAVEPWGEPFRATLFLARAVAYAQHPANYSLYFDIFSNKPLIDRPAFVRALERSLATVKLMPKDVLHYTPEDCRRAILSGRAAIALTFETSSNGKPLVFSRFDKAGSKDEHKTQVETGPPERPSDSIFAGSDDPAPPGAAQVRRPEGMQIGFFQLPGTAEVYNNSIEKWEPPPERALNRCVLAAFGGLCASVPPSESGAVREAACHLLAVLCRERLLEAFPETARTVCRESQIAAAENWVGRELTAEERMQYVAVTAESYRNTPVVAELPFAGAPRFRAALTAGLGEALSGQKTPADALKAVAEQWQQIASQIGLDRVRDSYRRRLGLHARAQ